MNNEETIFEMSDKKGSRTAKGSKVSMENVAYAVGGAAVGHIATVLTSSSAEAKEEEEVLTATLQADVEAEVATATPQAYEAEASAAIAGEVSETKVETSGNISTPTPSQPMPNPSESPDPDECIVATADGVKVAQVDDSASFSQAFADARAQVGAGGVFEWRGHLYGTYYKNEWEQMTPQERRDYYAKIDIEAVHDASNDNLYAGVSPSQNANSVGNTHNTMASAQHSQPQSAESEIRVVYAENNVDVDGDGINENVAVVEVNGHRILLVDQDMNGTADLLIADFDGDGKISEAEVLVADQPIAMPNEQDCYYAQNDTDYMNDADVSAFNA